MDASDWTPVRLKTLDAVLAHILPVPTSAVRAYVVQRFSSVESAGHAPFVLALLDEAEERAGEGGFSACDAPQREALLRALEADESPYFIHALGLVLQIGLEGLLGDPIHGGNPGGQAWIDLGLTAEGPQRRFRRGNDG